MSLCIEKEMKVQSNRLYTLWEQETQTYNFAIRSKCLLGLSDSHLLSLIL